MASVELYKIYYLKLIFFPVIIGCFVGMGWNSMSSLLYRDSRRKNERPLAEAFYANGRYDFAHGADKLENKIQKGEKIPDDHLRAYRIGREEILSAWLPFVSKVIVNYFQNNGRNVRSEKLFQYQFPDQLWTNIANFLAHLGRLPLWVDYQQSLTTFGGKSSAGFWEHVFDTGNTPSNSPVIHSGGLNVLEMIKPL